MQSIFFSALEVEKFFYSLLVLKFHNDMFFGQVSIHFAENSMVPFYSKITVSSGTISWTISLFHE